MSKNLHKIDKLFKNAIEKHEEEPSSKVWEAIDKDLDKKKVVSISKRYNKLKWVAAILLLFSAGMAMYILQIEKRNKDLVKKDNIERAVKNNNEKNEKNSSGLNANDNRETDTALTVNKYKTLRDSSENLTSSIVHENNREGLKNAGEIRATNNNHVNTTNGSNKNIAHNISMQKPAHINTIVSTGEQNAKIISGDKSKNIGGQNNTDIIGSDKQQAKEQNKFYPGKKLYVTSIPVKIPPRQITGKQLSELSSFDPYIFLRLHVSNDMVSINNAKTFNEKNKRIKDIKVSKESSFSATIFFSPEITSDNVRSDHPRFMEDDKNEIRKDEKLKLATNFGILVGYNFSKTWKLQSGVSLFTRVTDINSKTIYARPDDNGNVDFRLSCSSGSSYIPLKSGDHPAQGDSTHVSAQNTLQYVNIPLILQYSFIKGRLSINPGVGVALNVLSKSKIETELNTLNGTENTINNIKGLKKSYFSSSISLGAEYQLSKKIALSFVPAARLALSPINKDAPVRTTLNSFGFATGLTINF